MHAQMEVLLFSVLFFLAILPWAVSSCSSQPLLPQELEQERVDYEETVTVARSKTLEAQQSATSEIKVVPLGTLATDNVDSAATTTIESVPTSPVTTSYPAPSSESEMRGTPTKAVAYPSEHTTSIITVRTVTVTVTPQTTGTIIIIHSHSISDTPEPSSSDNSSPYPTPVPPHRLVETQDVITEIMLTEQLNQDAHDVSVSDMTINLTADNINAAATASVLFGIKKPIEAKGTFAVENDSLVVEIDSILFDGIDVTEQYHSQLEDRINSSLYRLLPQRYVKSYELSDGQIIVHSQIRP